MRLLISLLMTAALASGPQAHAVEQLGVGEFQREEQPIRDAWHIEQRDEDAVVVFSEDFRAARGSDLKVFLAPRDVPSASGETATDGTPLHSRLEATRGAQAYRIPAGSDVGAFESVLLHSERCAVLWGGGDP